ncbi:MAG: hypothetical protein J3K34DRAFT_200570 [Monoraphidium minutum]|nr:MAG: hypothetical protein J3K34DRAFT_200570 [Monoraphidium minutum]
MSAPGAGPAAHALAAPRGPSGHPPFERGPGGGAGASGGGGGGGAAADGGSKAPVIGRVIMHIDLDAFYCQVEQLRLGIPRDTPCAVQQWQGLIAVNYAARAAGITRHMRAPDATKLCPGLRLVHVQTIGGAGASDGAESAAAAAQRDSTKACLQRYRRASGEIMRALRALLPGCLMEKASIDEAYIDLGAPAAAELRRLRGAGPEALAGALRQAADLSHLEGGPLDPDASCDTLLAAGALVAARVRAQVLERLGYTCSAGIAGNKLLAKIGSARFKPNQQTLVLPRGVGALMKDMPLPKIKGLGGKLGQRLTDGLGAAAAGDVAAAPWTQLVGLLEDRARWVLDTCRGVDDEPVTPKEKSKSLNSCKSFEATSDRAKLSAWIKVLAEELAERLAEDEDDNRRRPKTLGAVWFKGKGMPGGGRGRADAAACMRLPPSKAAAARRRQTRTPAPRAALARSAAVPRRRRRRRALRALRASARAARRRRCRARGRGAGAALRPRGRRAAGDAARDGGDGFRRF